MISKETQAQRAAAMTSTHPPTNPILLKRWEEESTDDDLKYLIRNWMNYLAGKTKAFEYVDAHDKVYDKVMAGFYNQ